MGPWKREEYTDQIREMQTRAYERISPASVEQLIDMAGRQEVFARARALGWVGSIPPLWVWNQIAVEIIAENQKLKAMKESQNSTIN